jgi:hypothetical protein
MPVWPFQTVGRSGDALLGSASLQGMDRMVDARRVEREHDFAPVRSARCWFNH